MLNDDNRWNYEKYTISVVTKLHKKVALRVTRMSVIESHALTRKLDINSIGEDPTIN
jgi:hypothetical protein